MNATTARTAEPATGPGHVDVLIVGAGLSGIGAACRLQMQAPGTSYAIVEARGVSGGTWGVVRFPRGRAGSDLFTLRSPLRPRGRRAAIAGGGDTLPPLTDTAP